MEKTSTFPLKGKLLSNVTLGPGLNNFNISVNTPCERQVKT